jgi:hypothetical protein
VTVKFSWDVGLQVVDENVHSALHAELMLVLATLKLAQRSVVEFKEHGANQRDAEIFHEMAMHLAATIARDMLPEEPRSVNIRIDEKPDGKPPEKGAP